MSDQNYDFKTEERILFKHTLPYAVKQLKNGKVVMTFENTGIDVINDYGHRHFADLLAKVVAGQLFGKAQELEVMYEAAGVSLETPVTKYKNKDGWEYVLMDDGRFHATNGTNVFYHEDGSITITPWYPLIYTREQCEQYLTPVPQAGGDSLS